MTDEPHVGELKWQGEPQNSPVELWDGKQWVLVGCSTPTDEELKALYWERMAAVTQGLGHHPPRTGTAR